MTHMDGLSSWLVTTCTRIAMDAVDEILRSFESADAVDAARLRARAREVVSRQLGATVTEQPPTILFQPIVHLESGSVIAREAMVRCAPDEQSGAIASVALPAELELGALRATLAELDQVPDATFVCVNISPRLLTDPELLELVQEFACERLVLEIDADLDLTTLRSLRDPVDRLRRHGVRLALNGVGTGAANLDRITAIEPEIIKIDIGAAQRLGRDEHHRALVSEIVDVGRHFGAFVIATGIESSEQISVAQDLGVDAGQGLLLLISAGSPA